MAVHTDRVFLVDFFKGAGCNKVSIRASVPATSLFFWRGKIWLGFLGDMWLDGKRKGSRQKDKWRRRKCGLLRVGQSNPAQSLHDFFCRTLEGACCHFDARALHTQLQRVKV